MSDRRYDDEETAAIFLTAAENPRQLRLTLPAMKVCTLRRSPGHRPRGGHFPGGGGPARLNRWSCDARPLPGHFLGLPIGVERTVALNRWLTDAEWLYRYSWLSYAEGLRASGTVRCPPPGPLRQWTNGNLQALLEPTANGHRQLQAPEPSKGDARRTACGPWAVPIVRDCRSQRRYFQLSLGGHLHAPRYHGNRALLAMSRTRRFRQRGVPVPARAGPDCGAARSEAPHCRTTGPHQRRTQLPPS